MKALYYLLIRKAKIDNINAFLKENDDSSLVLPLKKPKRMSISPHREIASPAKAHLSSQSPEQPVSRHTRSLKPLATETKLKAAHIKPNFKHFEEESSSLLRLCKVESKFNLSDDSDDEQSSVLPPQIYHSMFQADSVREEDFTLHKLNSNSLNSQFLQFKTSKPFHHHQRTSGRNHEK